jgi:methylmalonyl-CoA/ethylmalonyl-CoA epimerase
MSSPLSPAILDLASTDSTERATAALEIYRVGRALADNATTLWWADAELSALLGSRAPSVTVGLAVSRETFVKIRVANGSPRLAEVPPDQDAEEFELHFPDEIAIDVLTSRAPGGTGAIAKYLAKFGEGVQQVEYRCTDVERATHILKEKFEVKSVYPETRLGADGTRVNFFLASSGGEKVLIELYETTSGKH